MDFKDNRQRDKRSGMKHHKKSYHGKTSGNGSSSSQVEVIASVIDVADSSDDRISGRPISWSAKAIDSELEIDTDNEQMRAGDFGLLTEMPNSIGGHFQFSSEKNWDSEDTLLDKTEASEYFTLDLNLLNAGLQTIPFYKRLDFPSGWFTKSQLKIMESTAKIAEKNYENILKEHEENPKRKISSKKNSAASARNSIEQSKPATSDGNIVDNDDGKELDELLNLTTNEVAKVNIDVPAVSTNLRPSSTKSDVKTVETDENREGIQQWLDDVLEE